MTCLFLATKFGEIAFDDCLVEIEEPLRDIEVLHGLLFKRDGNAIWGNMEGGPVYRFTGHRAEWQRAKTYRSRGERSGKMPKMQYGDGD